MIRYKKIRLVKKYTFLQHSVYIRSRTVESPKSVAIRENETALETRQGILNTLAIADLIHRGAIPLQHKARLRQPSRGDR